MNTTRVFRAVSILCLVLALLTLIGMVFTIQRARTFLAYSVVTSGRIIENVAEERNDGDGGTVTYFYPVVEFASRTDDIIQFRSNLGTRPPEYTTDETVDVRYDPTNPQDAVIDTRASIWFSSWVLGGVMVGMLFLLSVFGRIARSQIIDDLDSLSR